MINEELLKQTISKNLIRYRKINNLTQMELAVSLNYSDKAISKWERGESLPDIYVLSMIADFYHITVNDLITDQLTPEKRQLHRIDKLISLLSAVVVWTVATVIFVFIKISNFDVTRAWLAFIYALPASCLVLILFARKWNSLSYEFFTSSLFIWTIALALHLTFYISIEKIWMIYLTAIPTQLILALWYILKTYYQKNDGNH